RLGEVVALLVGDADGLFEGVASRRVVAEAWCGAGVGVVRCLVVLRTGASSGLGALAGSLSAPVAGVSSRTGPKSRVCAGVTPVSRVLTGVVPEPWFGGDLPGWWWGLPFVGSAHRRVPGLALVLAGLPLSGGRIP